MTDNEEFIVGNFAYSNIPLTTSFDGQDLWYHIFQEDETDLGYSVQINTSGEVVDISLGVVEFLISTVFGDSLGACKTNESSISVYTNDPNYEINSVIYTDQQLTMRFPGKGWYKIFNSSGVSLDFSIQIDRDGIIRDKTACE